MGIFRIENSVQSSTRRVNERCKLIVIFGLVCHGKLVKKYCSCILTYIFTVLNSAYLFFNKAKDKMHVITNNVLTNNK